MWTAAQRWQSSGDTTMENSGTFESVKCGLQEIAHNGVVSYRKVLGTKNPTDLMTKHVPANLAACHVNEMSLQVNETSSRWRPSETQLGEPKSGRAHGVKYTGSLILTSTQPVAWRLIRRYVGGVAQILAVA